MIDQPATTPAVSVIVTSYNYAEYLGAAIQSVLDQTYRDFEVVVVDDGSTDASRQVLAAFGERIVCLEQTNQGKSVALNRGLAISRGRYLAFLDSDDLWLPESLAHRVALLESEPDVGVVYSKAYVIDGAGRRQPYTIGAPERFPGETLRSLLYANPIQFLTFMVRQSCLTQVGEAFDRHLGAANDWDLYLRLSRVCRFHYLDEPTACWRVHGRNWSGNPAAMEADLTQVVDRALAAPDLPLAVARARSSIYRNLYSDIGLAYASAGQQAQAWRLYRRALGVAGNPLTAATRIAYHALVRGAQRTAFGATVVSALGESKRRLNAWVAASRRQTARREAIRKEPLS